MKNYYAILGIKNQSSVEEIKRAYRSLALRFHPDRGGDEERMKEINEAYDILQKCKAQYDASLRPQRIHPSDFGFTIVVGGERSNFAGMYSWTTTNATF